MEGDAPQLLIAPAGYINSTTPFFYPQPQITAVNPLPLEIYVSPDGSDDPGRVGSVTAPFATITNAIGYINALPGIITFGKVVCIFVAPGTYAGNFSLTDNMFLIGAAVNSISPPLPTQVVNAVIITDLVTVTGTTINDAPIVIQNVQLNEGVRIFSVFYDVALNLVNCAVRTSGINAAINIDPADQFIFTTVSARGCLISTDSASNLALVSATVSENTSAAFDGCQFSTDASGGSIINVIGSLTVNNCTLINHQAGTTLEPLIAVSSGATLTPEVNITNSTLKYDDIQADVSGNKLAVKFNADTQTITATMTNNTITIDGTSVIIKNIGALPVTLFQCANSCLLAGNTTDANNMIIFPGSFLDNVPSGGGGGVFQATYYKSAAQNLVSGNTDITFDLSGAWSNDNGYITHTGGTTAFNVVQAGLYQLEFNATILANGSTNPASTQKLISVDITRSPNAEVVVIQQNTTIASGLTYGQSLSATFNLLAGDVINCRINNTFTGGPAQASGVTNTFDLNTWFTWRYVSSGGGGGGGGVTSVAGLTGAVTFSSPGGTIGITPNGQDIELTNTGIVSLASLTGTVTLVGGDGISVTTDPPPGANEISIANTGVLSITPGTNITVTGDAQTPTINYVASPPAVQATTTTPLTPANVNVLYILTSGATQNFTTAGLGVGDGGSVWYVKNASAGDIDIDENGAPVAGQTATIHQGTGSVNSSIQVLYWNGTALTMY